MPISSRTKNGGFSLPLPKPMDSQARSYRGASHSWSSLSSSVCANGWASVAVRVILSGTRVTSASEQLRLDCGEVELCDALPVRRADEAEDPLPCRHRERGCRVELRLARLLEGEVSQGVDGVAAVAEMLAEKQHLYVRRQRHREAF